MWRVDGRRSVAMTIKFHGLLVPNETMLPAFLPATPCRIALSFKSFPKISCIAMSPHDLSDMKIAPAESNMTELEDVAVKTSYISDEALAELDRKTLLRLDLLLVPLVAMLYFLSFLDRSNLGNARIVCMSSNRLD